MTNMPRNAQPGTRSNKTFNDGMRTACDTLGFSGLPPDAAGFGGMASYAAGFVSWPLRTSLNAPCHLWRLQRLIPCNGPSIFLGVLPEYRYLDIICARQADAGVLLQFVIPRQLRFRRAHQADPSGVESGES